MSSPTINSEKSKTTDLWEETYGSIRAEKRSKERLDRLEYILKEKLGKPTIDLASSDGYKQLQTLIGEKSRAIEAKKSSETSEKLGKVFEKLRGIQDIVGTGASAGGPFVAMPVAALFIIFSAHNAYLSQKQTMFELAENVALYTLLHAEGVIHVKEEKDDDRHMLDLKRQLHSCYVGLYRSILMAIVELTITLEGGWQYLKNAMKITDWDEQLKELHEHDRRCERLYSAIITRRNNPTSPDPQQEKLLGPGPRNALHWAVAMSVVEQVHQFVESKEYPINALTPNKWTALHLAAERDNAKIVQILLTADGIDLRAQTDEGRTALHIAAIKGQAQAVQLLLAKDNNLLLIRDNRGRTAFIHAAQKGHIEVLEELRKKGQDFNDVTGGHAWSALHLAAERGDVTTVEYLLANGTRKDIKIKDGGQRGKTAQQIAERKGKFDVVAILQD